MRKQTKLTLKDLLARKEQMLESKKKPKRAELYVKSLDGTITVESPTSALAKDAQEMDNGDVYLAYQCVVYSQDKPLCEIVISANIPYTTLDYRKKKILAALRKNLRINQNIFVNGSKTFLLIVREFLYRRAALCNSSCR